MKTSPWSKTALGAASWCGWIGALVALGWPGAACAQSTPLVEARALPLKSVHDLHYDTALRRFVIRLNRGTEEFAYVVEVEGQYRAVPLTLAPHARMAGEWTPRGEFLRLDRRKSTLELCAVNGDVRRDLCQGFAGVTLQAPRAFCFLPWGELAVFDGADGAIVCGRLYEEDDPDPKPALDTSGVFEHPIIYAQPVLRPRVLVLNYDPLVPAPREGDQDVRLSSLAGWNDPHHLAQEFRADLYRASGGYLLHHIVEWRDLDLYPAKVDGFQYDDATYLAAKAAGKWHDPDRLDYARLVEEQKLVDLVARGSVDEVWMFGGPAFGFYETQMVGPAAYWCNSPGLDVEEARRCFVIFGFNYERGVAEMIHDLGHMTESILAHVYEKQVGAWRSEERRSAWEQFSALERHHPGLGAVGNCHFPVNGERDYDYANPRQVSSTAAYWKYWPAIDAPLEAAAVSCATWGGPDFHRNYQRWFFTHLPRRAGLAPDGYLANWWEYLFHFNAYPESSGR